ncbi:GNAT family N-acetyltransferase [Desertivirga brevis]|uniref:GNAT family N-acetyltransferase n=1 Tax=Desertivirga brevis TaxID=2810310 RepID=UPI001A956E48|nr:GNAT family N-acetyltransferase [Pedobacter sp. SYSU D00873]
MKIFAETERLILREILPQDEDSLFILDSDPEVHAFLGNNPIKIHQQAAEVVQFIRKQYITNGIGRWAVIDKETNTFVGWSGLKLITEETNNHIDYYDLGYRFIKKYWGNGYATETAYAALSYAFHRLSLTEVFAITDIRNYSSKRVLEKVGFKIIETFNYQGTEHYWFKVDKDGWVKSNPAYRTI